MSIVDGTCCNYFISDEGKFKNTKIIKIGKCVLEL